MSFNQSLTPNDTCNEGTFELDAEEPDLENETFLPVRMWNAPPTRRSLRHSLPTFDKMADATFETYNISVDEVALEELLQQLQTVEPRLYGVCQFALRENVSLKEQLQQMTVDYGAVLDKAKQVEHELQQTKKQLKVILDSDLHSQGTTDGEPPSSPSHHSQQHRYHHSLPSHGSSSGLPPRTSLMTGVDTLCSVGGTELIASCDNSCSHPTDQFAFVIRQLQTENEHLRMALSQVQPESRSHPADQYGYSEGSEDIVQVLREELRLCHCSLREKCEEIVRILRDLHQAGENIKTLRDDNDRLNQLLKKMEVEHSSALERAAHWKEKKKRMSTMICQLRDRLDESQTRLTTLQEEHISLIQQNRSHTFPSPQHPALYHWTPHSVPLPHHPMIGGPSHRFPSLPVHRDPLTDTVDEVADDLMSDATAASICWDDPGYFCTVPSSQTVIPPHSQHLPSSSNVIPMSGAALHDDGYNSKSFADEMSDLIPEEPSGRPPRHKWNFRTSVSMSTGSETTSPSRTRCATAHGKDWTQDAHEPTHFVRRLYESRTHSAPSNSKRSGAVPPSTGSRPRPHGYMESMTRLGLHPVTWKHQLQCRECAPSRVSPCLECGTGLSSSCANSMHTNPGEEDEDEQGLWSESLPQSSSHWDSNFSPDSSLNLNSSSRARKLEFIKPLNGSRTLQTWKQLATPSLVSALNGKTPLNVHSRIMDDMGTSDMHTRMDTPTVIVDEEKSTRLDCSLYSSTHFQSSSVPISRPICSVQSSVPSSTWSTATGLLTGLFSLATHSWVSSFSGISHGGLHARQHSFSCGDPDDGRRPQPHRSPVASRPPSLSNLDETSDEKLTSVNTPPRCPRGCDVTLRMMQGFNETRRFSQHIQSPPLGILHRHALASPLTVKSPPRPRSSSSCENAS